MSEKMGTITFCCPNCGRETHIGKDKDPFGKKKKCKGCQEVFELSEANVKIDLEEKNDKISTEDFAWNDITATDDILIDPEVEIIAVPKSKKSEIEATLERPRPIVRTEERPIPSGQSRPSRHAQHNWLQEIPLSVFIIVFGLLLAPVYYPMLVPSQAKTTDNEIEIDQKVTTEAEPNNQKTLVKNTPQITPDQRTGEKAIQDTNVYLSTNMPYKAWESLKNFPESALLKNNTSGKPFEEIIEQVSQEIVAEINNIITKDQKFIQESQNYERLGQELDSFQWFQQEGFLEWLKRKSPDSYLRLESSRENYQANLVARKELAQSWRSLEESSQTESFYNTFQKWQTLSTKKFPKYDLNNQLWAERKKNWEEEWLNSIAKSLRNESWQKNSQLTSLLSDPGFQQWTKTKHTKLHDFIAKNTKPVVTKKKRSLGVIVSDVRKMISQGKFGEAWNDLQANYKRFAKNQKTKKAFIYLNRQILSSCYKKIASDLKKMRDRKIAGEKTYFFTLQNFPNFFFFLQQNSKVKSLIDKAQKLSNKQTSSSRAKGVLFIRVYEANGQLTSFNYDTKFWNDLAEEVDDRNPLNARNSFYPRSQSTLKLSLDANKNGVILLQKNNIRYYSPVKLNPIVPTLIEKTLNTPGKLTVSYRTTRKNQTATALPFTVALIHQGLVIAQNKQDTSLRLRSDFLFENLAPGNYSIVARSSNLLWTQDISMSSDKEVNIQIPTNPKMSGVSTVFKLAGQPLHQKDGDLAVRLLLRNQNYAIKTTGNISYAVGRSKKSMVTLAPVMPGNYRFYVYGDKIQDFYQSLRVPVKKIVKSNGTVKYKEYTILLKEKIK